MPCCRVAECATSLASTLQLEGASRERRLKRARPAAAERVEPEVSQEAQPEPELGTLLACVQRGPRVRARELRLFMRVCSATLSNILTAS